MRAVRPAREAEAVAADDGAVLQDDAMADANALADRDARVDDAVVADLGSRPIVTCECTIVRAPMRAPSPTTTNGPIDTPSPSVTSSPTDGQSWTPAAVATDRRRARRRARTRGTDGARAASRTAPLRRVVAEDHRRGARRAQRGRVFRVGEEGEIAGHRRPRCRRRRGSRSPVAFEPALEAGRDVLSFKAFGKYLIDERDGRSARRSSRVLETQAQRRLVHAPLAHVGLEADRAPQLRQRRALLALSSRRRSSPAARRASRGSGRPAGTRSSRR